MRPSTEAYREEVERRRRTYSQGTHGRSFVVEVITDPHDPRGLDARRIGP